MPTLIPNCWILNSTFVVFVALLTVFYTGFVATHMNNSIQDIELVKAYYFNESHINVSEDTFFSTNNDESVSSTISTQ